MQIFGPQGADDELAAAGGMDGLDESSGSVGPWPEATLTVECTTGTPKVLMVLTVETAFLSSRSWSIDCYPEGSVILTQFGVIGNLSAALEH